MFFKVFSFSKIICSISVWRLWWPFLLPAKRKSAEECGEGRKADRRRACLRLHCSPGLLACTKADGGFGDWSFPNSAHPLDCPLIPSSWVCSLQARCSAQPMLCSCELADKCKVEDRTYCEIYIRFIYERHDLQLLPECNNLKTYILVLWTEWCLPKSICWRPGFLRSRLCLETGCWFGRGGLGFAGSSLLPVGLL